MYTPLSEVKVEDLHVLLDKKRHLYDQMIADNKEFDEVKALFIEIKVLEESIQKAQVNKDWLVIQTLSGQGTFEFPSPSNSIPT